jgi:SAM-dependent methyltransferase
VSEAQQVHHPVFARLYARMAQDEPEEVLERRRELLAGLSGRVVELGAGTGANFPHYPAGVTEVVAVEPEPFMRRKAAVAGTRAPVPVTVVDGTADRLPLADGSCDAGVACLVLCSVPDQRSALAELRRVLRPGGELRFYEHVLSQRRALASAQRLVDRVFWPRTFGNCHTARDTAAAIAAAGFVVERERRLWEPPVAVAVPLGSHVIGVARRP